jgi:hypothetical protein
MAVSGRGISRRRCSTTDALSRQARAVFERVAGRAPTTREERALQRQLDREHMRQVYADMRRAGYWPREIASDCTTPCS